MAKKRLQLTPGTKRHILHDYAYNKTEVQFMQEVLLPLFENMKYETNYNHGADEQGKDFVLKKLGDFGEFEYTAVVVKNGDIANTSRAKEKATLEEVKRQIGQSFNIELSKFGAKGKFPSHVIVVNSGKLSNSARIEIAQNQEYASKGNITFLHDEKLIPLIDEHYSHFFQFKMPSTAQYLSDLITLIEEITSVDSNFSGYIDGLNLTCRRDEGNKDDGVRSPKKKPEDIFSKGGDYWIQGGTGSGKTFTVYKVAQRSLVSLQNVEAKSSKIENPERLILPVYARARDIANYNGADDICDLLCHLASQYSDAITKKDIESWLNTYHVLLVLDEFEQNGNQDHINKVMDLKIGASKSLSILLLSREVDETSFDFKLTTEVWKLLDLNLNGVKGALKAAIPAENKKSLAMYKDLAEEGILERVPRTPLAINVLSHVFSGNINSTPSNAWEFFDMFFELTLGRWEPKRDVDRTLDYKQIRHFLERVAHKMVVEGGRSIPVLLLHPIASKVLESVNDEEMMPGEFIEQVANFGEVAVIRNNEFYFTQKTFLEFLAGCEYANHHWNKEEIIKNIVDLNWEDCLIFAAGQKKRDEGLLSDVSKISEASHTHLFFKMKNIALLVQALYQTDTSIKNNALKAGVDAVLKLRDHEDFSEGIKKVLKTDEDVTISLLTLRLFASFYGRRSLAILLKGIFQDEKNDRKKAYLFSAFVEELLENSDQETVDELVAKLPTDVSCPEILALGPYLEIEERYSGAQEIKSLLQDKKIRKLATKAHKQIASSRQSKKSKFLK